MLLQRRHYLLIASLVIAALLLSWCKAGAQARQVWRITSLEWEPYASSRMNNGGNAIQSLRNVLRRCNIELQVEFYPWRRAQEIARSSDYLGYFPAWPEEVRSGFVQSHPVTSSNLAVMGLSDSEVAPDDLSQLFERYRVGVVNSYTYPANVHALMQQYAANTDSGATSDLSLLKMLVAKRFDLAITDPTVLQYLADKEGAGELKIIKLLPDLPLVIALRSAPDNQPRIELIKRLLHGQMSGEPVSQRACVVQ